jgi:phosphatidate cytidylyltransferase
MLKQRLISAILMLIIFVGCFFFLPNPFFEVVVLTITAILFFELRGLLVLSSGQRVIYWLISLSCLLPALIFRDDLLSFSTFFVLLACFFWVVLAPLNMMKGTNSPPQRNLFHCLYGLVVIAPMTYSVLILYSQNKSFLLFVFITIWMADIGAYFTGKRFGSIKIAASISPGKSMEGALGGIFFNVLLVLLVKLNFAEFYLVNGLIFCITISALSIYGDLYESLLKRLAGVKDSSNLIPGHGGFLDRVDGFLPALPAALIFHEYLSLTV